MTETWTNLWSFVAPFALGGAGAFVAFLFLLPTKLGERLLIHSFDQRMAAFRHEQSVQLGKLQANLDHLKDRGLRSNEREYQAISQTWEHFVEAFRATKAAVIQLLHFPDLDVMAEQDVISFLDANTVPEESKTTILATDDKKRAFSRYIRNKLIKEASTAVDVVRDTLQKQSVFIPVELGSQFEVAVQSLHDAWVEQSLSSGYESMSNKEASMDLIRKGDAMFASLRDAVRARLLKAE